MAKDNRKDRPDEQEMSLEEASKFRASLNKSTERPLSLEEKREQFRIFWTEEKSKYNKNSMLESVLWEHLKSTKMDSPSDFRKGLEHFGIKKIK